MPNASEAVQSLQSRLAGKVGQVKEFRGEISLEVDREVIGQAAGHLKSIGYRYLVDISGVDFFGREPRFEVSYEFARFDSADHVRLRLEVSEDDLTVPSLALIYPAADWHEREVYDMMGITFTGHPNLQRILMWPGYPYYPLRKDFPLEGKPSDAPGEAFSSPAPLEGGPFVTAPAELATEREPRAHPPEL